MNHDEWVKEITRRHSDEGGLGTMGRIALVAVAAGLLAVLGFFILTERVDATEECVVKVNGRETGVIGPGLRFKSPWTSFECYTVTQKTMELVAGDPAQSNSQADYVDYAIRARSKDGIDQYAMLTLQYHIDRAVVADLYPTYPNDEAVKEQLIKSRLRSVVPQVLSLTDANYQFKGNLGPISDEIEAELRKQLDPFGIKIDYFELKRSDFDDVFEQAIRNRAGETEKAEQARLAQITAKEDAERLRIETEGTNAANLAKAQTDAEIRRQQTDAEVYDLQERAKALQESPALLEWERTQAIRDAGAVYLPSGTLPIYQIPEKP